jgi:hypothetical protein
MPSKRCCRGVGRKRRICRAYGQAVADDAVEGGAVRNAPPVAAGEAATIGVAKPTIEAAKSTAGFGRAKTEIALFS